MWSPAKTILVSSFAKASGMIASHSMAWAASSNKMWLKCPAETQITAY
jgi:hypothetical protein